LDWAKRVVLYFAALVLLLAGALWIASLRPAAGRNKVVVDIDRPPTQVFPWLIEPEKLKQWIAGFKETRQLTPGPVGVGTKSRDLVVLGSDTTVMNVEITALEPNKLLAARIDSDGFTDDIRYQLTELNGKTRLEYTALTRYKIWLAKIMEPVITPAAQKKLVEDTAKLKALIQAQ
jgi:uncharacterized protein YndB with AHSA1/START domain